jgi:Carboxypeptidase regulatory-like domain/TonB dependent receptor
MRVRPTRLLFSSLLLVVCLSTELNSQTTTSGGLAGVVTDPSHAVVPGADVEIQDIAKGTVQSTKTDREGVYRFFFLPPGRYALAVMGAGFRKESRAVNVLLGPPVSVNVTLAVAPASATVTVTQEAPLVQAENGDVSTTMNQKQISEVPNPGNDLTDIVQTAPGVVMNTDMQGGTNFSILGMPGTSNRFTINGMNDNDNGLNLPLVGSLNTLLGQNQIQEATVVSIGYSGQFGGTAGANINYITKSGGNDFHGNAQYYWNGRVFNANNWVNKALPVPAPRPFDIANQWAGSFGGPIKRGKLFFFFDTEGLRVLIPQQFLVVVPSPEFEAATIANIDSKYGSDSASASFYRKIFTLYNAAPGGGSALDGDFVGPLGCPTGFTLLGNNVPCARHFASERGLPSRDTLTSGRVDWNARGNDRVFLQIQNDRGYLPFYLDSISPLFDADGHFPWWQGQLVETHTFSSLAASQFLLAGTYLAPIFALVHRSQALTAFPATLNFNTTLTGFGAFNSLSFPSGRPTTQYQLSEDLMNIRGKHKFGFGANFERIYWTMKGYTPNALGTLTPQTLDAFYQGGVDPASPDADFTALTKSFSSQTSQRITFYNLAFYGQDEWHARPNLTLTLALRAEHQSNPACQRRCFARMAGTFDSVSHDPNQPYNQAILINQKQAFVGTDDIVWSPRFSFAWQPMGVSHNTVIRGGVGIFYDPVPGNLAWTLSSNPPLLNSYTIVGDNLAPQEKTSLFKDASASNSAFVQGFGAGQTLAQIQTTISSLSPNGFSPPGITVPDRQTHSPQYQRWSLELQQTFGAQTSLSIGYTGHHGIHELVLNPSANAFGFGSLPSGKCASPPVSPCYDSRFSGVTAISSVAVSNYNGMVISVQHRFTRWVQGLFQANYTYGHAFDEVSNGGLFSFTSGSASSPQDPNNLRGAYGPAEYDVRHSFNASYVWEVPIKAALGGHGPDSLVNGWQISGTIFARTGFPYTVFDFNESASLAPNNYFGAIYAVPVHPIPSSGSSCGEGAAFPLAPNPCQPPQVFFNGDGTATPNPNAHFVQSGCETGFNVGTLGASDSCIGGPSVSFAQGRNRFRGPSYFNTDFTIMKNTKLPGWEKGVLGIGFQFFNFFNHENFSFPFSNISDPLFGQVAFQEQPPTSILGARGGDASARMIQVKAQLQF